MEPTDLAELNREVEELHRRKQAESQRQLDELFERSGSRPAPKRCRRSVTCSTPTRRWKSSETTSIQMREEERARYRD